MTHVVSITYDSYSVGACRQLWSRGFVKIISENWYLYEQLFP